jgi:hypothetical protein
MKKIGLICLVLVVILVFLKDFLVQSAICRVGSSVLGARVTIGSFSWNLITQKIHIRHLYVFNPPGFPHQPMVDIPAIDVDYDLVSLIKGQNHFPYIHVDLKELSLIKNTEGQLNVDALKVSQKPTQQSSQPSASSSSRPLSIDIMKLSLGRTVYVNYEGRPHQPSTKVFNLGFKEKTFKNITSVQQLSVVILTQAMAPAIKTAAIYGAAKILEAGFLPMGIASGLIHELSDRLK